MEAGTVGEYSNSWLISLVVPWTHSSLVVVVDRTDVGGYGGGGYGGGGGGGAGGMYVHC